MTKQKALSLVRKKWGKDGFIREDKRALDPETREIVKRELEKHLEKKPVPPPPTPEQLAYQAAYRAWRDQKDLMQSRIWRRRWDVGYVNSLFAHIIGSGDTVEEACQKAKLT